MAMQRIQLAACVSALAVLPSLMLPASGRLNLHSAQGKRHENNTQAEVASETAHDIQIHEVFAAQEAQDVEGTARHPEGLSEVQAKAQQEPALCENIVCGTLHCPSDFAPTKIEGHCCPYCVSPTVKYAEGVQGASGEYGGEPSTFCANVWCFPTMCSTSPVAPSTENGLCCEQCAS